MVSKDVAQKIALKIGWSLRHPSEIASTAINAKLDLHVFDAVATKYRGVSARS